MKQVSAPSRAMPAPVRKVIRNESSEHAVPDREADHLRVDRDVCPAHLLRLQQELLELFDLGRRRLDAPVGEPLVGDPLGRSDLDRGQRCDPHGAAELLGGVDRPGGLSAIILRDSAQAGRIVDGKHHAEPETLKQKAGDERSHGLLARGGGQREAGR